MIREEHDHSSVFLPRSLERSQNLADGIVGPPHRRVIVRKLLANNWIVEQIAGDWHLVWRKDARRLVRVGNRFAVATFGVERLVRVHDVHDQTEWLSRRLCGIDAVPGR